MHELDRVIQQNATTAEEMSSTSEEFSSQAGSLLQSIRFFKADEAEINSKAAGNHVERLIASRS